MFLQRILDTPHLAKAVARLQPELLHRVIQKVGLEDASELVALATPEQLSRVFDLDLWQSARPGVDEQFDAARFGTWLQVLHEAGAEVAAAKLAAMEPGVVAAGLAQHLRVFDVGTAMPYYTLDGELMPGQADLEAPHSEMGGYRLMARRTDAWDAIVEVLLSLESEHGGCFHDLMGRCRAVSSSRPEESGMDDLLHDPEQAMFDLGSERERRREQQGYVTPAQARAFLDMARRPATVENVPSANPVALAYFRSLEEPTPGEPGPDGSDADADAADVAAVVEVLLDSGVLEPPPRALLTGAVGEAPRLARIHEALRAVVDRDPVVYASRSGEIGYLANTLISGCSLQGRAFTPQEASDAVLAVCNLGLQNWPAPAGDDVLVWQDLVGVFQVGWNVLHEKVGLRVARRLIEVLAAANMRDRDLQIGLARLRTALVKHVQAGTPWGARASLEVMASVDLLAWAGLLGLIDECPVMHAAVKAASGPKPLSVRPDDFDFISDNTQIEMIEPFLSSLDQVF